MTVCKLCIVQIMIVLSSIFVTESFVRWEADGFQIAEFICCAVFPTLIRLVSSDGLCEQLDSSHRKETVVSRTHFPIHFNIVN